MKHLFLDLEDTVITPVGFGWHTAELIKIDSTKEIIDWFKPAFVHLFSFAIHSEKDVAEFNKLVRPMLEDSLDMKLSMVPNMDQEIIPKVAKSLGWHPTRTDFDDLVMLGKQICFRLFVENIFGNTQVPIEVLLLDDTVMDETWEWPDLMIKGRMIHV